MKLNNLELLTQIYTKGYGQITYAPNSKHDLLDIQSADFKNTFAMSKKFYLSVEKSQLFYDAFEVGHNRIKTYNDFKLPFDISTFIFEKPLVIKWTTFNRSQIVDTKIFGFICRFMTTQNMGDKSNFDLYKVFIIFDEDGTEKLPKIGEQYIYFAYNKTGSTEYKPIVIFPEHLCLNKQYCMINDVGFITNWGQEYLNKNHQSIACQEIANRESFIEMIFNLVDKIHESEVTFVERKTPHNFNPEGKLLPAKPDMMTKGNLPKPNYVQYLDGKSYRYNKDDIDEGAGTPHRYRYDVRRHPRIVNGHLVWINSHQRGSGSYIPKVYANRKTWFINYFWYQAEKLSKHKAIELVLVKIIHFLKFF